MPAVEINGREYYVGEWQNTNLPVLTVIAVERHGIWEQLEETTPSGKLQFKCKTCGRVSVTPDKWCEQGSKFIPLAELWGKEVRL